MSEKKVHFVLYWSQMVVACLQHGEVTGTKVRKKVTCKKCKKIMRKL